MTYLQATCQVTEPEQRGADVGRSDGTLMLLDRHTMRTLL